MSWQHYTRLQCAVEKIANVNFGISGSHAALTCHIALMRHRTTGVVSVGHFDNFCCWQFGEESSAHRDGIKIMLKEIGNKLFSDIKNINIY